MVYTRWYISVSDLSTTELKEHYVQSLLHSRPRFMKGVRPTEADQMAMAAELGADTLHYRPVEAIARCIGIDSNHLCRACKYLTPTGEQMCQLSLRQRNGSVNGNV